MIESICAEPSECCQEVIVAELEGEFSSLSTHQLDRLPNLLAELCNAARFSYVLLDMRNCRLVGAAFVGAVADASRRAALHGTHIAICNLNIHCREVIRLARLDRLVRLFPQREQALQALARENQPPQVVSYAIVSAFLSAADTCRNRFPFAEGPPDQLNKAAIGEMPLRCIQPGGEWQRASFRQNCALGWT